MASPKSFNDSIPDFFKIDDKILTLLLVAFIGLTDCLSNKIKDENIILYYHIFSRNHQQFLLYVA